LVFRTIGIIMVGLWEASRTRGLTWEVEQSGTIRITGTLKAGLFMSFAWTVSPNGRYSYWKGPTRIQRDQQ
jgi:hypothetical protein